MLSPLRLLPILGLVLLLGAGAASAAEPRFCIDPPHDALCPVFPEDLREFSEFFEYMLVSGKIQRPFDEFAWQAFVALNWPETAQGRGKPPAGWRAFARRDRVFGRDIAQTSCPAGFAGAEVIVTDLEQVDDKALVDRNGNYVVYETRLNRVAEAYIVDNALNTLAGVEAAGGGIGFPQGRDAARPASVLVKTAWQVLSEPRPDFITAAGLIVVPPERSASGKTLCLSVHLGMVGMHVVTKVASGHGEEWVWATFERRDNAPVATNARAINSIYAQNLFPGGCAAPEETGTDYLFYDRARPDLPTNAPPPAPARWAETPPFAVGGPDGQPLLPTQVVRCWKVFDPTRATNALWQDKLAGTPLAQYMLISAQWRGANKSPLFEHGELPRYLSNVTMETYLQADPTGTCLGCHAEARTAAGQQSDFTYLLRDVVN